MQVYMESHKHSENLVQSIHDLRSIIFLLVFMFEQMLHLNVYRLRS
jgi:hypothetical protein